VKWENSLPLKVREIAILLPLLKGGRCEKIDLVLFYVIPAKAGIQRLMTLQTDWTPVFTGVTAKIQFLHGFGKLGAAVQSHLTDDGVST